MVLTSESQIEECIQLKYTFHLYFYIYTYMINIFVLIHVARKCQEAVWPNRASIAIHGITCPLIGRSIFNIPTLGRLTNHQTN